MESDRLLPLWVVYVNPADFPDHIVVRVQWATRSGLVDAAPIGCLYTNLLEVGLDYTSAGLTFIERDPRDEPQIVGCYL